MNNCCNNPIPDACVTGGWPPFEKYGFTFKTSEAPLTWTEINSQIHCKNAPFAFSWQYSGGGGHVMVAIGYDSQLGTNYVVINDPGDIGDYRIITYDAYVSGPYYTHWIDYYDITKP